MQVLMGRTNADMAALKNMYYMKYHKALETDVKEDVSGYLEKLFVVAIQVRMEPNTFRQVQLCEKKGGGKGGEGIMCAFGES